MEEKNKGGRPALFDEPTKVFGIKMGERELADIDNLAGVYNIKSKSQMFRLLVELGRACMEDSYFVNYCIQYKLTPSQMFNHIFNTWREHLQKYAPPLDTTKHSFDDIMKIFE